MTSDFTRPWMGPSIDLHVHLRGTLRPKTAFALAKRHGIDVSPSLVSSSGEFQWTTFNDFLRVYDAAGAAIRSPDDLYSLAEQYLRLVASEGTRYVEFMLSPQHSIENGIRYEDQLSAISEASSAAFDALGIRSRLIATCVRHNGPTEALRVAELVARSPHPAVVGFGMTGDERQYDASLFAPAFSVAADAGLSLTCHAGEWLDARSVMDAVETLQVRRIGHGLRAVDDPGVLRELAAREVTFEICLTSNDRLGAASLDRDHPVLKIVEAGCKVCFGTDDPGYLGTSPAREYGLAQSRLGLTQGDLERITSDAISAAFCNAECKHALQMDLACPSPSSRQSPHGGSGAHDL